jgi:hypothetical protein
MTQDATDLARYYGIGEQEIDLLHIAERAARQGLPPGWTEYADDQQAVFYHNVVSGKSQYEHPNDASVLKQIDEARKNRFCFGENLGAVPGVELAVKVEPGATEEEETADEQEVHFESLRGGQEEEEEEELTMESDTDSQISGFSAGGEEEGVLMESDGDSQLSNLTDDDDEPEPEPEPATEPGPEPAARGAELDHSASIAELEATLEAAMDAEDYDRVDGALAA